METKDLNQKIELWGMVDAINDIGETTRTAEKIKDVWCKIIPKHGSSKKIGSSDVAEVDLNVIIRCRVLSVKNPAIDMFFMRKGIKYKVVDFIEDMKNKTFIEFSCEVVYE